MVEQAGELVHDDGLRLVVGLFSGPYNAGQALTALREAGIAAEQVSVVAKNTDARGELVEQTEMGEPQDRRADTMVGALTGSALGGALGLGALFIPGVGPVIAAGALAATVGGAAIGAFVGGEAGEAEERGIAGAGLAARLTAHGVPTSEAVAYQDRVHHNDVLVAVQATGDDPAVAVQQIITNAGGVEVRIYGVELPRDVI